MPIIRCGHYQLHLYCFFRALCHSFSCSRLIWAHHSAVSTCFLMPHQHREVPGAYGCAQHLTKAHRMGEGLEQSRSCVSLPKSLLQPIWSKLVGIFLYLRAWNQPFQGKCSVLMLSKHMRSSVYNWGLLAINNPQWLASICLSAPSGRICVVITTIQLIS